ncbi:MAG: hypothetical protein ILO42_06190 [Clostridia bacterium]|nr:hypothetical protein [Clostridia bacterium]
MSETNNNSTGKAGNPKVELLISRNPGQAANEGATIDFFRLFSTMKSKRGVFLRLTAALVLIGMAAALFLNVAITPHPSARAILTFNYPGAENGTAPDGGLLETDALKNTYIVTSALSSINLSRKLPASSVAANISAERILSDESKKELEAIAGLDPVSKNYFDAVTSLQLVYTNRMIVTLKNGFVIGGKSYTIPDSELKALLERILDAFRAWMVLEYADTSRPETFIDTGKEIGNDFLEQLDRISDSLRSLSHYAAVRESTFPDFRSPSNGLSFADVKKMIDRELVIENDHIYAHIYLNSISVNPELLLTNLNYKLTQLAISRTEKLSEIAAVETAIENYKKEQIEIIRKEGEDSLSTVISSDYYNSLILNQTSLKQDLSAIDRDISVTQNRIDGFEKISETSQNDISDVETKMQATYSNSVKAAQLLYDLNEELISSGAFNGAMTNSVCAFEKTESSLVKKVGIGVAGGAAMGIFLWFGYALIAEFKLSSGKKEEN